MNNKDGEKRPDLSIIIACYNEAPHLLESVREIEAVMREGAYSYELVFIDDGSNDETRNIIARICRERNNCRAIFHEKNVGRGGTVREGLLMTQAPYAGFLDIDLEVPAWYIPVLARSVSSEYDMACIERIEKWSWRPRDILRSFLSNGYKLLVRSLLSVRFSDSESGYKFFRMDTMRGTIEQTRNPGWFWDTEIIAGAEAGGKKIRSIRGVFTRRPDKQSTVRVIQDTLAYLKAIRTYRAQRKQ